jgi:hypothetical protein
MGNGMSMFYKSLQFSARVLLFENNVVCRTGA